MDMVLLDFKGPIFTKSMAMIMDYQYDILGLPVAVARTQLSALSSQLKT